MCTRIKRYQYLFYNYCFSYHFHDNHKGKFRIDIITYIAFFFIHKYNLNNKN